MVKALPAETETKTTLKASATTALVGTLSPFISRMWT
jgi:hypothetical protein